jgi:S1-C subfamily serine protease
MRRGDIITEINGEAVRDLQGFYRILREKTGRELWFSFKRGDASLESMKYRR